MSNELATQSQCFGAYDNGRIIAFCAVLHQPHSKTKNIKRCSRLVVLPDYQGIGIGTKFLNSIAEMYVKQGYEFSITTSAKNLAKSLIRNQNWTLTRYNQAKYNDKSPISHISKSNRNCKTFSFFYKK